MALRSSGLKNCAARITARILLTRLVQPRDNDSVSLELKLEAVRRPRRRTEEHLPAILKVEYAPVTWAGQNRAFGFKGCFPENLSRILDQIREALLVRAEPAYYRQPAIRQTDGQTPDVTGAESKRDAIPGRLELI